MEELPTQESFVARTIREMEEKGFQLVGEEFLGRDKFDSDTAKFLPIVEQTVEDIKNKHGHEGKFDIKLIPVTNPKIEEMIKKGIIDESEASKIEVPDAEKSYLVFRKPI